MLGQFEDTPTETMIQGVEERKRHLCYSGLTFKTTQFFIIQYYEITLKKVIRELQPQKDNEICCSNCKSTFTFI